MRQNDPKDYAQVVGDHQVVINRKGRLNVNAYLVTGEQLDSIAAASRQETVYQWVAAASLALCLCFAGPFIVGAELSVKADALCTVGSIGFGLMTSAFLLLWVFAYRARSRTVKKIQEESAPN